MTHREFIRNTYEVIAETDKGIYYKEDQYHGYCEINGGTWPCYSLEQFRQLLEDVGEDDYTPEPDWY